MKNKLAMLVCALFLCASATKAAAYEGMHVLSVQSASDNFESATNTFWITDEIKTFSFSIGYMFSDISVEQDWWTSNLYFQLAVNFDTDLFDVEWAVLQGEYLQTGSPRLHADGYGLYSSWNPMKGDVVWNDGSGSNLLALTFTLKEGVELNEDFSAGITLDTAPNYDLSGFFGVDAPTITVMYEVPSVDPPPVEPPVDPSGTPEPATLLIGLCGILGGGLLTRYRRKV